MTAAYFNLSMR